MSRVNFRFQLVYITLVSRIESAFNKGNFLADISSFDSFRWRIYQPDTGSSFELYYSKVFFKKIQSIWLNSAWLNSETTPWMLLSLNWSSNKNKEWFNRVPSLKQQRAQVIRLRHDHEKANSQTSLAMSKKCENKNLSMAKVKQWV